MDCRGDGSGISLVLMVYTWHIPPPWFVAQEVHHIHSNSRNYIHTHTVSGCEMYRYHKD